VVAPVLMRGYLFSSDKAMPRVPSLETWKLICCLFSADKARLRVASEVAASLLFQVRDVHLNVRNQLPTARSFIAPLTDTLLGLGVRVGCPWLAPLRIIMTLLFLTCCVPCSSPVLPFPVYV
jgi:hypothetical protein